MALILWNTKVHALILISSLGINMLFYVVGSSYPTTESPQNINSTTSTWFNFRDWTEIQGRGNQSNIITSQHPFSPKNFWSYHKIISILLKTKHILYSVQNPQKHHA
jgi:hypothetical protein